MNTSECESEYCSTQQAMCRGCMPVPGSAYESCTQTHKYSNLQLEHASNSQSTHSMDALANCVNPSQLIDAKVTRSAHSLTIRNESKTVKANNSEIVTFIPVLNQFDLCQESFMNDYTHHDIFIRTSTMFQGIFQ